MCIDPGFIWLQRGAPRQYDVTPPDQPNLVNRGDGWAKMPTACKKCWRCKSNRINDYVGRGLAEASTSDWTLSLTLTYAPWESRPWFGKKARGAKDDLADKILTPRHAQNFVRALRRSGHSIRYLIAGEYGELKGRAHFHAVIFGKGKRPQIPQKERAWITEWPHGHVFGDWSASESAIRYASKYIIKDAAQPGSQSWFSASRKPPLGAEWFAERASICAAQGVMPASFLYAPPGGDTGRAYMMSRATRRDFISALTDAFRQKRTLKPERLDEYVAAAVAKIDRDRWQAVLDGQPWETQFQNLRDKVDITRLSPLQAAYGVVETFGAVNHVPGESQWPDDQSAEEYLTATMPDEMAHRAKRALDNPDELGETPSPSPEQTETLLPFSGDQLQSPLARCKFQLPDVTWFSPLRPPKHRLFPKKGRSQNH